MNDDHPGRATEDGDAADPGDYCRHVETYLCQKNDGHLIRIAGPSFSRVSGWALQGIPLNVVYRGVDRYFERYYARGQRRRPVHIDFCEGDVLAVFDEWRRAVGFQPTAGSAEEPDATASQPRARGGTDGERRRRAQAQPTTSAEPQVDGRGAVSLAAHLDRVIVRLTTMRAGGRLTAAADAAIDAAIRELDRERRGAAAQSGDDRTALLDRLRHLDSQLAGVLLQTLTEREQQQIEREAGAELLPFKAGMAPEAYERASVATRTRLVRHRMGLPVIAYED